ncbi:MAG: hypothetical protein CMN02_04925 [Roseibacillus sp.]|nr:hypothetical protein [Roseibacillus sp.]
MISSNTRGRSILTTCLLIGASLAKAQLPHPDLQTIFPQGGQAGQTVEVVIGGAELGETTGLLFSHPGIKCEQIPTESTEFTPAGHKALNYLISVAPDVAPGVYEVVAATRLGMTAPRAFAVSSFPERVHQVNHSPETAEEVPINTVINGHADAAAVDHYKVSLKQGQRVIIRCEAEIIDSRMDGTISIADSDGHEYKSDRDTSGRDPLLDFTAPRDDHYLIRVHDFTYAGGVHYPYRLIVTDAPHIDFIDPPAGPLGSTGKFKIYGRNLPGGSPGEGIRLGHEELESIEVEIPLNLGETLELQAGGIYPSLVPGMIWRLESNGRRSNPIRIGFSRFPIIKGNEGQEQAIQIPSEIHARFDTKGDLDQYRFEAKGGQPLWIECIASRIRAGSDSALWIDHVTVDAEGIERFKEIASNDDSGGNPGGLDFPFRTNDCSLLFTPPSDGSYRLRIHDYTGGGGPADFYRLIIHPGAPDYDLVATAWYAAPPKATKAISRYSALIRRGGTTLLRVFAIRRNGFKSSISLSVQGLPDGIDCPPVILPAGKESATLVLYGTEDVDNWQGFVRVVGTAGDTTRTARPGTISWSIGNRDTEFTRSRLSCQLPLSVTADEPAPLMIQPASDHYEITLGEKLEIPFKIEKSMGLKGDLVIAVHGLPHTKPPSVKLKQDAGEGKVEITFGSTAEFKAAPGLWTFSLRGESTIKHRHNLSSVERAQAEEARIIQLEKETQKEAEQSKSEIAPAQQALQEAEQNLAAASVDARETLEKLVSDKKLLFEEAQKFAAAAEQKVKRAAAARQKASEHLKRAHDVAKEKDRKHTTHSKLITVLVHPAPTDAPK